MSNVRPQGKAQQAPATLELAKAVYALAAAIEYLADLLHEWAREEDDNGDGERQALQPRG